MVLGIIYSIIVSILFTLYAVPRKFSKQNVVIYMFFLGLAFSVVSIIIFLCVNWTSIGYKENMFSIWHLLSALTGIVWFFGAMFLNISIDKIGISKSSQWKSFQGPIGSLFMLVFLAEYQSTNVLLTVIGAGLIFLSAIALTVKSDSKEQKDTKMGVLFALLAALMFGTQSTLVKLLTNQGLIYSKTIYFALFVTLSALVTYLIKYRKVEKISLISKDNIPALSAGGIYGLAALFQVLAYMYLAGSISYSIIQLCAVWTILIGVFFFKEISFKEHWVRILLGVLLAIASIVVLVFAI